MSELLYIKEGKIVEIEINGTKLQAPETVFQIDSFWGGNERGACIQITTDHRKYEQFNLAEVKQIVEVLNKFIKEEEEWQTEELKP